jgi:hydrogenase/urease accessory protein HupE
MGGAPLAGEELPHPQPALADDPGAPKTMPCGCPAPTAAQLSRGVLPIHPSLPRDAVIVAPAAGRAHLRRGDQALDDPGAARARRLGSHRPRLAGDDGRCARAHRAGRWARSVAAAAAGCAVVCFREGNRRPAASGYFWLGVEHILFGIDHLLFVLALVLIVRGVGLLVKTITAFTIAHSITLGLATLGYVHVPTAPVEATIALSIVFVASEILRSRRGARGLTDRAPWLVAGVFGLLHGFGFAGALAQVGLPPNEIPLALLFFNLGVEAGQLAFVTVVLAISGCCVARGSPQWAPILPPYAIGSVAMFWVIERTPPFGETTFMKTNTRDLNRREQRQRRNAAQFAQSQFSPFPPLTPVPKPMKTTALIALAILGVSLAPLTAQEATPASDAGALTRTPPTRRTKSGRIRLTPIASFPRVRISATRISTRRSPWMRARSGAGSIRGMRIASRAASRSWRRADNRRSFRARSTSSSSPITRTTWAFSPISRGQTRNPRRPDGSQVV